MLAGLLLCTAPGSASGQTLSLSTGPGRVLLGDPVVLQVSARLEPGQELIDPVPRPLVPPSDGVQILAADSLRATGEGTFAGTVRIAFYRLGNQPVPTLALLYRSGSGQPVDTLLHQPISLTIAGLAPAGAQTLKDIRPLADAGPPAWAPLAILISLIVGGGLVLWRAAARSRPHPTQAARTTSVPEPIARALEQLDSLEAHSRRHADGVHYLYLGVSTILRTALLDSGLVGSPGLTTPELRDALPAQRPLAVLLEAGDLVRFAGVQPDRATALAHLAAARRVIQELGHAAR